MSKQVSEISIKKSEVNDFKNVMESRFFFLRTECTKNKCRIFCCLYIVILENSCRSITLDVQLLKKP